MELFNAPSSRYARGEVYLLPKKIDEYVARWDERGAEGNGHLLSFLGFHMGHCCRKWDLFCVFSWDFGGYQGGGYDVSYALMRHASRRASVLAEFE